MDTLEYGRVLGLHCRQVRFTSIEVPAQREQLFELDGAIQAAVREPTRLDDLLRIRNGQPSAYQADHVSVMQLLRIRPQG